MSPCALIRIQPLKRMPCASPHRKAYPAIRFGCKCPWCIALPRPPTRISLTTYCVFFENSIKVFNSTMKSGFPSLRNKLRICGTVMTSLFCGSTTDYYLVDAFCGCGGNSIAICKQPNVTVIAVDVDRSKLRPAANNAASSTANMATLFLISANGFRPHCSDTGRLSNWRY